MQVVVPCSETNFSEQCTRGDRKVIFLRQCNCDNNEINTDDSYIFCNYDAIFPQSLRHFQHTFVNVWQDAVYQCCKIPCFEFGAHHERYKETLNKLRQRIPTVRPHRNTKGVLLLHDSAWPHTNLHTRSNRKNGLLFPILLTAHIWHSPTTTCFALYRMHYVDAILQMTKNWKKGLVVCSKVQAGLFTTLVYSA
jgi:hypothetical protein